MHYEGINNFPINCPCTIELTNNNLIIKKINPNAIATLPMNRIISFSALGENDFLQHYKATQLVKSQNYIPRYFLVIQYDKGVLVFWGTAKVYKRFLELQCYGATSSGNIEL